VIIGPPSQNALKCGKLKKIDEAIGANPTLLTATKGG